MLTRIPPRRYDPEILDNATVGDTLVVRSLRDVACSNLLFRGTGAMIAEMAHVFHRLPREATLLDVGTGLGDIPRAAQSEAARHGVSLRTIGFDAEQVLVRHALTRVSHGVCGDARHLPFASKSVDVVSCSQVLHHFRGDDARMLLREMNRVARVAVVVSDVRRSWLAAAGFWIVSFPLFFHPITRHDGVVSVMRGFTPPELASTIHDALGVTPIVQSRLGFRVTTAWKPV